MIRAFLFASLFALPLAADTTVTLLHFSDYHSHARPFFSEGRAGQGGVARAVRYLRHERANPNTLVFSGGDMINKGAPAWSDKYGCAEWSWFNGIVDAMAYGNHDSDYGADAFANCAKSLRYPILGANVVDANGRRIFDVEQKPYVVFEVDGARIGVFAAAGGDFETLVKPELRPLPGAKFTDRVATAREVVRMLREGERVDAVVLIGHAHREDDEALARAVPGIDLIFGTHSHIRQELTKIAGTSTWFISPFQYLTYVSRVRLRIANHRVAAVTGRLVSIDETKKEDPETAQKVTAMQHDLESDSKYAELFRVIGDVPRALLLDDQLTKQTPLGTALMSIVRKVADADLAISTTSSFRQPLAPGPLTLEDLRATLPYPNKILVYQLSGADARKLLTLSNSKKGSDTFGQISGATSFDPAKTYRIATTDYLAKVAPGYREFFAGREATDTGLEVRDEVMKAIGKGAL